MRTLFKNIFFLYTFDETIGNLENAYILVEDNIIKEIGTNWENVIADKIIDLDGYIVLPGFVNTHHHMYQTLTRGLAANSKLFDWLVYLYEIWKFIDEEAIYVSTIIASYEMIKTGVTTTTDHLYLYPYGKNNLIDAEIKAAREIGIRFYPTRGSMSLSKKDGGLPPDSVVQKDDEILSESERVIQKYHDDSKYSMLRIALAPCSPFSVTKNLMVETLRLSEKYNILLHTHLAETYDEEIYCMEKFGKRPVDYMEELGWLNDRVWFAHLVYLNEKDIEKLSLNNVGMAHCPSSNMRLGSGIAPVFKLKDKIKVGIAVDGSASNDTNNMLLELRNTLLLQRVKYGANSLTVEEVLKMGTLGGASVLQIDDYVGTISKGKAADFIGIKLDKVEFAGALHEPINAILLCDAKNVELSVINGKIKIYDGNFLNFEIYEFVEKHNKISERLIKKSIKT
ncbi:hydroxydechloroatrazine ethylaminohydrolase [Thermosipho melanesiensis]|uniref:Hydroxydechloroatrazine ethylaminohydrolase n=2 Tax=Thermosipho melanesiensis TaxID=46541 RepID=A6LNR6_THEM4|nr:8-oxoguanine deaminase [Thermosipho melanesiensis]ABR31567.1 Hydroxydechloroatrazine ethylaminohydrolase [Thermosipho melanesiensis BI429]APT74600.1 hydroxydechloroatrazine ethylaminohydrolase [Thermosipho melanesiensis]OOC35304.1 hydroxydechloroatrazine ethylaminohydrolase [Thermosipho melanesiensis]OOC35523.1 hydroxydechloroatrazine ethylaminohydrolase [Thermosipho melanesiensis]OOC36559.1 hydroxydechloroatrazine ethylaminohydrolase [Thermosipho melanesiensis]